MENQMSEIGQEFVDEIQKIRKVILKDSRNTPEKKLVFNIVYSFFALRERLIKDFLLIPLQERNEVIGPLMLQLEKFHCECMKIRATEGIG